MPRELPLDKQKGVRSSQYTSEQFQRLIVATGQWRRLFDEPFRETSPDNAAMESFFHRR